MEIWSPRTMMINEFTKEHINNIRVKYVNGIFFHPKNKLLQTEIEDVVVNRSNFHVSLLLSESCFLICTVYFFCSYIK
uniref:Uncharacterized protein n=1 Tax=Oryza punctata TaxID=4537 RepID=A0A0E0LVT5_ORYPU